MNTDFSNIKQTAQFFIEYGASVIPCCPRAKHPMIKGWTKQMAATSENLEQWLASEPSMNLGLVLGSVSGIIGVDIDGDEAVKVYEAMSGGDMPPTWCFVTPGGGQRFLYRIEKGIRVQKWQCVLEGEHSEVAFLGDGQQTILPPSIHPNGQPYEWFEGYTPNEIPIADAPEWILSKMGVPSSKSELDAEGQMRDPGLVEASLKKLSAGCIKFQNALEKQSLDGLDEETWFKWLSVLVNSGHSDAAKAFSKKSAKHDRRSEERIQKMVEDNRGIVIATKCGKFGCTFDEVKRCFPNAKPMPDGRIKHSPAHLLIEETNTNSPAEEIYQPYIEALAESKNFGIDSTGHLVRLKDSDQATVLSNFVARPVLEEILDYGSQRTRLVTIEGVLHGGISLKPVTIPAHEFASMNWIAEQWGLKPRILPGYGYKELVREAIQHMGRHSVDNEIYGHIGWRKIGNSWAYLHTGGAIGADNIDVTVEHALERYRLPNQVENLCDSALWSFNLLDLAPWHVMIPLLALAYLAPLTDALSRGGIEPNFLVWLYGSTGTRKTSLAMVMQSHFGAFRNNTPPASFRDTANAIEKRAHATKDSLLVIDDYCPESTRSGEDRQKQATDRICRMYGDRIGRGRMGADCSIRESYPPRGLALVTGEDIPEGQSTLARLIGIELNIGDVKLEELTAIQSNIEVLAEAMSGYIQWLAPQMDTLPQRLRAEFEAARSSFSQEGTHGRTASGIAFLRIGFNMLLSFMVSTGGLDSEEHQSWSEHADEIFLSLVKSNNSLVFCERPEQIFTRTISELIASSRMTLSPLRTRNTDDVLPSDRYAGWYDNDYYYFLPGDIYSLVTKTLAPVGQKAGSSMNVLFKRLAEAGMIEIEESSAGKRQFTVKKTVWKDGQISRIRLLKLKRAFVDNPEN